MNVVGKFHFVRYRLVAFRIDRLLNTFGKGNGSRTSVLSSSFKNIIAHHTGCHIGYFAVSGNLYGVIFRRLALQCPGDASVRGLELVFRLFRANDRIHAEVQIVVVSHLGLFFDVAVVEIPFFEDSQCRINNKFSFYKRLICLD